jgi:hypothetical protein
MYINGGSVMISELERANVAIGTALQVTYTKKVDNTKIYELALLG